jgi:hypothetical protein
VELLKKAFELIKDIHNSYLQKIDSWCEIVSIENEVRALSNSTFLDAFKQVAHEISEMTGIPYLTYLNESKEMLLQGVSIQDTMYYFDSIWCVLMFGKTRKGGESDA